MKVEDHIIVIIILTRDGNFTRGDGDPPRLGRGWRVIFWGWGRGWG